MITIECTKQMKAIHVVLPSIFTISCQLPAQTCAEALPGLVSHYRFEEGTPDQPAAGNGTVRDFVDNSSDGTPGGYPLYRADVGLTRVAACQCVTNSLSLELGAGQSVKVNSPFILHNGHNDATLEFLVKPTRQEHVSLFWTRPDNNDRNRFNIAINANGGFGFDYRSPSGVLHLTPSHQPIFQIPLDEWTHIAVVRDTRVSAPAHRYDFYVNGVYTKTQTDPNPDLPVSNQAWQISGRAGFYFRGSVDEIRFSSRKLARSEFLISPRLTIVRNEDQTISLSWCGAGNLEQTNNLAEPNWLPAPSQENPQIIDTEDPMKFFRVRFNQ